MSLTLHRLRGWRAPARFVASRAALHPPGRFPAWTPTLPALARHLLGRRHPFWKEADRALFVARRAGRDVGRIAAIENRAHTRLHGDATGFFGFFEVADDPDAAAALVEAARDWLDERGLERIRGPVSPSMNYECGCLVEGFDGPNAFLTP
ncbi:MAG: GNAT family N-acetyltransferase, partial [Gemmatimonadota bacterium]